MALFCSLGTPITCYNPMPILAADGQMIAPKVKETTVNFPFNLKDYITKDHFPVNHIRH
jgi:hypothetical protein